MDEPRRRRPPVRAWIALALLLVPMTAAAQWAHVNLRVKDKTVSVELARTPAQRQQGLMFRDSLGADEGMLFVFETPQHLSFWMKNTKVPLSIAYLDADGAVLQVEDMEPYSESPIPSKDPCLFALEVNRGWFARNGIRVGDRLDRAALDLVRPGGTAPATR